MNRYTKEDVLRLVEEEDVEFIRLQFTDIFGALKNVAITASQLERALDHQCMFDGAAIDGFSGTEDSDLYLYPDFDTLEVFPWRPQQGKVARLICNVCYPDGTAFEGDCRRVLQNVIQEAADMGYTFHVGPECEFFLFHSDEDGLPTTKSDDRAGYFDLGPLDLGENARRDMVLNLEDMGFVIEASHHEMAPGQHEIDVRYEEALASADNIMTFKLTVKSIAKRHGLHATFMPKPVHGVHGSGMHVNMSLNRGGRNMFADDTDSCGLSETAYQFMAGLLRHVKGMALITNPLVNSYKRLVPGFEAPVYLAWSVGNRSTLVRVPASQKDSTRIELRSPDPCCNPYLTLALCLAAGLDGIRQKMMPPDRVSQNVFAMTEEERMALGIEKMPSTLGEAIQEFEQDEFVQRVLGKHIAKKYLQEKKKEWAAYQVQVTDWEVEQYLMRF